MLWEAGEEGIDGGELSRLARAQLIENRDVESKGGGGEGGGEEEEVGRGGCDAHDKSKSKEQAAEVVEVNGDEGDVMLVHPFLLHARSKNCGTKGLASVRFMCHPAVPLRSPLNVLREKSGCASAASAGGGGGESKSSGDSGGDIAADAHAVSPPTPVRPSCLVTFSSAFFSAGVSFSSPSIRVRLKFQFEKQSATR